MTNATDDARSDETPESPVRGDSTPAASDPSLRVLGYATAIMLVLVLGTAAFLVYSVTNRTTAPRTATERVLYRLEAAIDKYPDQPTVWADYAEALVDSGDPGEARDVLRQAKQYAGDSVLFDVEAGRIALAQDEVDAAADILDVAIAELLVSRDEELEEMRARGMTLDDTSVDDDIVAAYILLADVELARGEIEAQIEALDGALEFDPTMADILSARGDAHAAAGDEAAARDDYLAALNLIPDYEPAVTGLAALGE